MWRCSRGGPSVFVKHRDGRIHTYHPGKHYSSNEPMKNMSKSESAAGFSGRTASVLCRLAAVCLLFATAAPVFSDTPLQAYRIGPEDVLQISVWREESLDREVLVRPDGGLSFPLAGDVQAAGKTVDELQIELTQRIGKFISEPVVTVSVNTVAGYRVYILGQVKNPGQFVIGRYVDVLQALTLAGGLTPFADEDGIKIVRREAGGEVVLPFDYSDIRKGRNLEQNVVLRSDDVVLVP
jgi:polysaccharide export outer membrane protein